MGNRNSGYRGQVRSTLVERAVQEHTGTVVLWESLERVLKYKVAWGENSKNALYRLAEQLEQHLGMVFHRFLSGRGAAAEKAFYDSERQPRCEPWDPFALSEKRRRK